MSILDLLAEHKVCRINLPTWSGTALTLECVARCSSPPEIEANFLPKTLPLDEINTSGICQLYFEMASQPHAVKTGISGTVGEDRLQLSYLEVFHPTQQREYFRVDTEVELEFKHDRTEAEAAIESYQGRVNLSGGGIYFPVRQLVPVRSKIILHLGFGDPFGKTREIAGDVVRIHRSRHRQQWVGVKFTQISIQDRDRIIAFCLSEQRRILRQRVQTIAAPEMISE